MRVVIVRHGKAEPHSPTGSDFDRDLRPRGERQARYLRDRLVEIEPPIGAVVSSGAVRARRTAEIIASGCGVEATFDDRLLVDEPVSPVLDLIAERRGSGCLVLVGHNPQCGHLVSVLTGAPMAEVGRVRTGEAVVLEVDPVEPLESGAELDRLRFEESSV